jgi:DNA-binding HxlR family transcriptional regulator
VSPRCECDLECPCPPVGLIDIVGRKWAVCVIALLGRYRAVRFGPIQRCLSGVSPATLTTTLRALESARLVRRVETDGGAGTVRSYALTRAGEELYRSLLPFTHFLRGEAAPEPRPRPATPSGRSART